MNNDDNDKLGYIHILIESIMMIINNGNDNNNDEYQCDG